VIDDIDLRLINADPMRYAVHCDVCLRVVCYATDNCGHPTICPQCLIEKRISQHVGNGWNPPVSEVEPKEKDSL
jgi:hypothetical protein